MINILSANTVTVDGNTVTKQFNDFPLYWVLKDLKLSLQRIPYTSPQQRFQREWDVSVKLEKNGLNVPEVIGFDTCALSITYKRVEFYTLVEILKERYVHCDDKLDLLRDAMELLYGIHDANESHGDSMLRNFGALIGDMPHNGRVLTFDFEFERDSPDPQVTDLYIMVADAMRMLRRHEPTERLAPLSIADEVFGHVEGYRMGSVEQAYFRRRFRLGDEFFRHFSIE